MRKIEKIIYILIFYSIGFFLSSVYRPYIYSNKINDFGIADIGNNVIFIPGIYFLCNVIFKKPILGTYKDIVLHTSVLIVAEILSYFINGIGTFDFKDIFGLLIGAGMTYLIMKLRTDNLTDLNENLANKK